MFDGQIKTSATKQSAQPETNFYTNEYLFYLFFNVATPNAKVTVPVKKLQVYFF